MTDNEALITGEYDAYDAREGGDGLVYAASVEEALRVRAELRARGLPLHGVKDERR